ncbi:MAG: type II toxin-antitoxin system VapC family toxin [Pyrinomonadaceae bacterium]
MNDVIIDTNIVIWYFSQPKLPSTFAQEALDKALSDGAIFVTSITIVELTYLIEKNKIPPDIMSALVNAIDNESSAIQLIDLTRDIAERISDIPRSIVADMPDRIIAATALHLGLPLVTSDRDIQKLSDINTIW